MTDLEPFLEFVRDQLFYGSLPEWQWIPIVKIVREGERRDRSLPDMAYVLATAYHETARFKYSEEIGQGSGKAYGAPCPLMGTGSSVTKSAAYYGRGMVQTTWLQNYAKLSVRLTLEFGTEIDFVNNPDLASNPEYSALIIWKGMIDGMFTGKNLADYINADGVDYVNARRIVNGTDKAEQIADYARTFEAGLKLIGEPLAEESDCPLGMDDCPRHA